MRGKPQLLPLPASVMANPPNARKYAGPTRKCAGRPIPCAFIILLAAALTYAPAAHADGGRKKADGFSGDALYRDVVFYSSLGEHRTATATNFHSLQDTPETISPDLLKSLAKLIRSTFEQIISDSKRSGDVIEPTEGSSGARYDPCWSAWTEPS